MSTSKSGCASKITIHCEVTLTKPSCLLLFICKILSNKEVIFTILPTNVCYRPVNIYIYIKTFNYFYLAECFMLNKGKTVREYNVLDYFRLRDNVIYIDHCKTVLAVIHSSANGSITY